MRSTKRIPSDECPIKTLNTKSIFLPIYLVKVIGSIKRMPEDIWSSIRCGLSCMISQGFLSSWFSTTLMLVSVAIGSGTCYVKVDDNGSGVLRDDWCYEMTGADGIKICNIKTQPLKMICMIS